MTDLKPPTGRAIVQELQRELESRLYPLMYKTLAPGIYHVYLHPDDYGQIQAIAPAIVADAQQGLNERVDALNGRGRWTRLVSGKQAPIEIPAGGWEIHLHPETNGELMHGELGIESRLSIPPPPQYGGGASTTRIARTTVTGTLRRSSTEDVQVPPSVAPVPDAVATTTHPTPGATDGAAAAPPQATPRRTARLTYVDEDGSHTYAIRKDLISIGRGGSAHWVDVQVVASTRVSREHCRIRRAADGRYFLQDVSTWGTSLDGNRVTPFARHEEDGRVQETGDEHALVPPARIQLADAVTLEFVVEP